MTTALYARVSSGHQEQDRTIESQIAEIERWLGAETVDESQRYVDDGWSGAQLQRPALDALRDAAVLGTIGKLVIYAPDRLARRFVDQQIILEELERQGVDVYFVTGGQARNDEERMLLQVRGVFAEYERAKIVERTRRGKLHRARQGVPPGWSNPPYGYRYLPRERAGEHGRVVIEQVEAQLVQQIFEWIGIEGLTIRQVVKRLRETGMYTRSGKNWMTGTISKIIRNPVYIGSAHHQKYEAVEPERPRDPRLYRRSRKSSTRRRPREQWIETSVPALIEPDLFGRVQRQLEVNRARTAGQSRHPHLLRGVLTCTSCGRRMIAQARCQRGRVYRYYTCNTRDVLNSAPPNRCELGSVRADDLEDAVWEDVVGWLQEPEQLVEQLRAADEQSITLADAHASEQRRLSRQLRSLDGSLQRLLDAYQEGAIALQELKARRERIDEQRDRLEHRLKAVDDRQLDLLRQHRVANDLRSLCRTLAQGLRRCRFDDRRAIVELVVDAVEVGTDSAVKIHYVVPLRAPDGSSPPDPGLDPGQSPGAGRSGGSSLLSAVSPRSSP